MVAVEDRHVDVGLAAALGDSAVLVGASSVSATDRLTPWEAEAHLLLWH